MMDKNMNRRRYTGHNKIYAEKGRNILAASFLALVMTLSGVAGVFADSASMAEDTFTDTITHPGDIRTINKEATTWTTTPNSSTDNPSGVHQSQDNQTPYLTFGSAMPLSTIYIDTSVFWNDSSKPENAVFAWEKSSPEIGFGKEISTNTTQCNGKDRPYFDPTVSGARKLLGEAAGAQGNYFSGPLYSYTFPGAATLPDGSSANVKITYSNMHLYVDTAAPNVDTNGYQNKIYLPLYNDISFEAQNQSGAGRRTAGIIDARIQVVDDNGKPIDGTFIYAMCGLNVYRSENAAYHGIAYAEDNNWFSEGIRVNSGTASDIYVRSANATESGDVNPGYWPKVSNETAGVYEGAVRFDAVARAVGGAATNVRGENNTYQTGFVTTANASTGISLTGQNTNVNTWLSKGAIMWHRIRSVSGPGGSIKTTTEGNKGGTLDDKSDNGDNSTVLDQGTYVVPDGKTVVYTMKPDRGYVLKDLRISDSLTQITTPISGIDTMTAGEQRQIAVATGKQVTITKLADGSYTAEFPENNADHTIMVTWIPDTTDNVSVDATKKWYDKNNAFSKRKDIIVHVNGEADYGNGESYHYPADFLPAQLGTSPNNTTVADGNEAWIVKWGDGETNNHGYTGAVKGETVYAKLDSPGVPTADSGGNTYYWFYDYSVRKFRAYTYNSTTGEFVKTNETIWVNFLPKYDESGKLITYTVEEEVPDGYSLTVTTNNSGTASLTMADFDYTLKNTLEPVGTVKVKATKALDGRPYNGTDEFVFVLSGKDGAPMPVGTAVKIPAEGEDTAADVVKTVKPTANTVLTEADFGVISYRKSDLTATKITYGTPSTEQTSQGYVAANAEQKNAVRFWTVKNIPTTVDKTDDRGYIEYKDSNNATFYYDSANNKLYDSNGDEVAGFDINNYTKQTVTTYADKTFDMLDNTDTAAFNALDSGLKDIATATAYERVFEYVVTENPKHPDYVENDENTYKMTVRVFYNEKENKIYIEDEDSTTTKNGVTDITAETTTALTTPAYTLHRDFFTNTYDNKVSWEPEITKTLNGRPIKKDQFKDYFTIKAVDTTETVPAQVKDKVSADETPMPGGADATTGVYPHGGTAVSTTQEIESASSAPKGTNDVKAIVGFDGITYTNEDLKKEIYYNSATDAQKKRVIEWTNGSNVYGPIPAGATASVTQTDGSTASVTYDNATDAQREEAKATGWTSGGKTYFDLNAMTATEQSAALAGSQGYYYLDSRKFTYKIWESGTAKAGYTNDTAHDSETKAYEVEVTVTRDNRTGELSVAQNKTVANLAFENEYEASTDVALKGKKVLNGRDLKEGEFSFTISAKTTGAPLPANVTVTNASAADGGTIDFGKITFTQNDLKADKTASPGAYDAVRTVDGFYEKTFVYEIKETAPTSDANGITRDTSTKTIAITVREDDKGNIKVVAVNGTTAGDADRGISFTDTSVNFGAFTNEYEASGSDTVDGTKTLNGGKLNAGDFHFQLLDNQGTVLGTVSNDANGKISFPVTYNLSQVKEDATDSICSYDSTAKTWTYTYTMKELKADNRGTDNITYDATGTGAGYTLTVVVKDNENGTLAITPSTDATPVVFVNTVSTRDLSLTKIWIDNDADEISKVTRPDSVVLTVTADVADTTILSDATGTAVTQGWTVDTATGKSTKNFTLTRADDAASDNDAIWRKTIEGLPRYKADGTAITYTVDELDANVPVNYKKSVIAAANTVVNTYTLTSISGTKVWVDGGKAHKISADLDGKLTVKWTDAGGSTGTISNPHIDYDNTLSEYKVIGLPKYSDDGDLRTYYVEETQLDGYKAPVYDNSASTDTSLTPEQKGATNRAYNEGKITNTIDGKINVTGTKEWKDGTASPIAPATSPTLTLTRVSSKAGSTEETVSATPTWTTGKTVYTFSNLDKYDSEGYEYTYKVTEAPITGYLPPQYSDGTYAANGGTITNIKEPTGTLDIPVTKVMTGSTRISDWNFEVSLYTGQNAAGTKVGDSKNIPAGTLAADGKSETSTVTFEDIAFRLINDNGTVKAQMMTKDNLIGDDEWVDLTDNGDGTYSMKLYAHETKITSDNTGLTQPSSDTDINIIVTNNNDGTISVHMTDDVTAGAVITDNNDGTVLAEASQEGYKVANKHEQSVEAEIDIKKTMQGIDLQADDSFIFTATYVPDTELSEAEQARLSSGLTDTSFSIGMSDMSRGASTADTNHPYGSGNSATGKIKIPITKTGTYKFNVTESGSEAGVTNDAKAETGETVTVKVEKDTDGKLKYSVTYADGSEADFTNIYEAEGDAQIHARKIVNGADWDEGMSFWFKLVPKTAPDGYTTDTMPKPEKDLEGAHKDNGKTAEWDLAGFTQDSIGKEFVYSVTEQKPNFNGYDPDEWEVDTSEHTVTIVPYDKGNGTLGFRHYHDGSTTESGQSINITNRKKGTSLTLFASKEVVNKDGVPYWPSSLGSFDITLTALDGAPMPGSATTVTKAASDAEELNFGTISFDDAYNDLDPGEEKTFTYEYTETVDSTKDYIDWGIDNTSKFTITVKIAKDAAGNIIDPVVTRKNAAGEDVTSAGYPVIKNKYLPEGETDLELTKILDGDNLAANEFSFTLYDANKQIAKDKNNAEIKNKKNDASGKVELGTLKFDASMLDSNGRATLTYNIREDIPVGAVAQDDETLFYAADTTLEVRDAHVWVKDGITYDPAITHPVTITLKDNGDGTITATPNTATSANKLNVTNIYEAEGSQTFSVYKYLEERPIRRAGFEFELKGLNNAPMPSGVTGDTTTTKVLPDPVYKHDGTASFADIVYTMDDLKKQDGSYETSKTFEYEIKEIPAATQGSDGLTYADTVYKATVTVSNADSDGELDVSVAYTKKDGSDSKYGDNEGNAPDATPGANGTLDFTNIYDSDGSATMNLAKTILGRAWQDADTFKMNIEPLDDASYVGGGDHKTVITDETKIPLPGNTIDQNHRDLPGNTGTGGTVEIKGTDTVLGGASRIKETDEIKFTDDMLTYDSADGYLKGVFIYKVTEDTESLPAGFTQTEDSTKTYYVRIDVLDDRMGTLETTVSYYDNENNAKNATSPIGTAPLFSNTYDSEGEAEIPVKKFLDQGSSEDDSGWALLGDSDTFSFTAAPVGEGPAVTPTTLNIDKNTKSDDSLAEPDHKGVFKVAPIELSMLTFTTSDKNKDASGNTIKYSDGADVLKDVKYMTFIGHVSENDLPASIKGVDKDDTEVYVRLTAIDKLDGTIDTQWKFYKEAACVNELDFNRTDDTKDIEFTNIYRDVMDMVVQKTWHDAGDATTVADRPAIKIQLTRQTEGGNLETLTSLDGNAKLYAADDMTEISYANGEATVRADQLPVTFKNLPATDRSGNAYTYNIVETDAGEGYYESKDPEVVQEGKMDDPETAEIETEKRILKLTNTMSTKVHVEKVWQDADDDSNRGSVIVAALYRNGVLVPDNIKLVQSDSDPEWQTVFEDLPMYDENDNSIDYTAREMAVPEEYYTSLVEYSLTGTAGSWSTTKPNNWNTAAEKYVRITNILLTTLEVEKEWAGIPTDNVTYELYRTTGTPDEITGDDWDPTQPNADDSTWEKVMASDGTTPLTHTFRTEEFYDDNGDLINPEVVKYTFTDLERYDKNGNKYNYRVFESTGGPYFESEQVSDVKVKNTNVYDGVGYAYPNVVKELEGRRWLSNDEFYFKIEPIKGIDDEGKAVEFTDSDEDQAAKAKVPLPADGDDADEDPDVIAKADVSKKVGAIGRSVDFNSIMFVSGDGDAAHVTEGGSADYYYMIYEVDKDGTKVGGDTVKGITYTGDVHTLRIHLEDDGLGNVTTQRYWDGAETSSAVPVYVNKYKAYGISYGYVIKRIAGRDFKSGDEFTFEFTNLSGSPVRRKGPDAEGTTEPTTDTVDPVGYPTNEGVYVSGTAGKYDATGESSGADKAQEVGVNYINSGDLVAGSDGKLRGTFVYQFREIGGRSTDTITKVEDLEYDSNLIYLRVSVEDNEDGTLKVEHKYFLDAACTQELEGREKHEPLLLVDLATGDIAPAGAEPGTHTVTEQEAADPDSPYYEMEVGTKITYGYVASGYFRNRMKGDIPIAKKWVTEDENGDIVPTDPIDNVTVNLRRMAVFVNPQDGKYYNEYADGVYSDPVSATDLADIEKWDPAGTHVFEVSDFYFTAAEAAAYNEEHSLSGDDAVSEGDLKTDAVDYVFKGVEMYDHNADTGVPSGKIYIYRLREASGSEAYESTYRLGTSETEIKDWTGTDTTGEKVTVVNKVVATNVANIAAVKQLMGRDWLSVDSDGDEVDRYKFQLTPVGMGTYDANGELVKVGGKVKMDEDVGTKIPMPDSVISSELTEKDKALAAKVTQYASGAVPAEEIVGEGERLARFGPIEFKLDDLVYNEKSGNMQGDFFYTMKEEIPNDALLLDSNGDPTSTTYEQATDAQKNGGKFFDASSGITYDSKIHNVHIRVTENRTKDLVVQVAYDEKTEGDISTGTQFTPVYTNSYTATGDYAVSVDKKIMGRKWKEGDKFDFTMQALGGAPFKDTYPAGSEGAEFAPDSDDVSTQRSNLDSGLAIHNANGTEHVKRLIIDSGAAGTTNTQTLVMPTLKYKMSELGKTTTVGGQFKYSNGRDVPAGTKYEEFMYALEEENLYPADYPEDINLDDGDDDTEYVKVIAIDKGDGTLDFQVKVYEDRFGTYQRATDGTRYEDGSSKTPATHATFVNQALRDIKVVKTWKGEPVENAEIKLQYRLPLKDGEEDEGQGWEDYEVWTPAEKEKTENLKNEKISGLDLRVAEYEHIFENIPVYGDDGGDIDSNDSQLEWRIIETSMDGVKTYYGVARPDGADAAVTEDAAPSADGYDETQDKTKDPDLKSGNKYVEDLDGKLYVTNVHAPTGEATRKLSVVKELAGRDWMSSDKFTFTLIPIGMGTYNEAGELYVDGKVVDRTKLRKEGGEVYTDIPLPEGLPTGDAVATDDVDPEYKLTDSQRQARFGDIKYDISDLRLIPVAKKDANGNKIYRNNETGEEVAIPDGQSTEGFTLVTEEIYMGDFVYDMVEVIPDTATGTLKSDGTTTVKYADVKDQDGFDPTLYTWKDGDIIYSTDKHDVHVHVERQNGTMVTSVSYDGKETGGAVPVFVNEYDPATMDIPVTKTWVAEDKDGDLVPTKPIDNITVNIRRYAVFIGPDGKYYEDEEHTTEITLPDDLDEWAAVGTHTYRIGDFYWTQEEIDDGKAPSGTSAGDLKTEGVTNIFKGLETDEVKDGELTGRKYVYRVREATRSDAYDTSYTVGTGSEQKSADDWTGTDTTGDELGIVNKIEATNVANIAAVKQMVGRDWIDNRDSYDFKLTPVKGLLPDGSDADEDPDVVPVADIPMPDDDDDGTTDDDTATTDDDLVVGENERLARFLGIEFDLEDLGHNETTGRMEGDFYYTVAEVRANDAKVSDNGYITYDTKVHDVHVQVRENRTGKLEVIVSYDETTPGNVDTGTQFTPVFVNRYADTDLSVRKVWAGDTDIDGTAKVTRPLKIGIQLQSRVTTYTYDSVDYPTKAEAAAAAEKAGGTEADVTTTVGDWADVGTWTDTEGTEHSGAHDLVANAENTNTGAAKADDDWVYKYENMPVRKATDKGVGSVSYQVIEPNAPNGYTKLDPITVLGTTVLTNVYEATTFEGSKIWNDGGKMHDNATELKDKLTLQRTTKANPTDSDWTTVNASDYHLHWNSDGAVVEDTDQYKQTFTITGLADKDATTGDKYTYRVVESSVGSGYEKTYTNTGDYASKTDGIYDKGTVTNTKQGTVTVMAKKVWEGDTDDKSGREEIKFQLMRTVDEATKKDGAPKSATASTETYEPIDGWVVWKDLPTIVEGKTATYDVEEVKVPDGYTSKTEYGYDDEGTEKWAASKEAIPAGKTWNNKIRITNTLETDTIDVPVMVKWDDTKNQDGIRPDSVTVTLQSGSTKFVYKGEQYDSMDAAKEAADQDQGVAPGQGDYSDISEEWVKNEDVATKTLNPDNNWKGLFKDVPKTDSNGKSIEYKVVEQRTDVLADEDAAGTYDINEAGDTLKPQDGWVITNTHTPEDSVRVTVTKKWTGDDDVKSTTRKDTYYILIGHVSNEPEAQVAYIGEQKKIKVDKTAAEGAAAGTVSWKGLPKYIDGQEIIWDVLEESIPGYTTSYGQTTGTGGKTDENNVAEFTVTNEYVGAVKEVTATKVWEDDDNRDGMRKDVKLVLYRQVGNGEKEKVDEKTISKDATGSDLTVKWTKLPEMTIGGTETTTRTETVPKYVEVDTIVGDENPSEAGWYELVNEEYVASTDTAVVADKKYYKQDGTEDIEVDEVTTEATHGITYWVEEEDIPDGYTSVITQTDPGVFEARNIHAPEKKDIVVKKLWNDDDDKDKIRPDHVTFKLKDGSTVVAKAILTEDDNWAHTFEGMPVKKNGEKINYTVEEDSVAGYTASGPAEGQDGSSEKPFTITNTRNRKLVDVKVKKVWAGDEGHEAETRGDVKVNLVEVVDGARKVIDTQTLSFDASDPDKEMSYEWKSQPTHRSGKDITYEVTENGVDEYTMTGNEVEVDAQGNYIITITNTYGHIASHDVIYVDPKNNDGEMILKSDKYSPKEAQKQAQGKLNPPAEPSHSGTKFIGWAVNYDENGNWVLVAKYQDNPVKPVPTISYIDPQSGKVIVSKQTDDPSSVKPPANPKAKNMQFTGWVMTTDAAGNTIWLAKYECDCSNGGGKDVDKSNVDTGDDAMLTVWMLLFVMAVSFMVLTMMLRNRGVSAVRDTYKPKH